jgi:hypothetical protein
MRIQRRRNALSNDRGGISQPPLDPELHRRQLEILRHFGTIDFDPDYDPLEMRRRDREQLKREIESRDF